jgi:LmbE family N-acetylglucosaminyl deacetylase
MTVAWAGRRLLLVVAHPDDETFGCGSLVLHAAAAGAHVTVCCATRGEAGELAPGCTLGGRTLAEQRTKELHDAADALGAKEVVLLDFRDSDMSGEAAPETLVGAPFESVVEAVAAVLAAVDPDVVVTLDPTGVDGHRDHTRIGAATVAAVGRHDRGASLYYWSVARSLLVRWFETLREADPESGHLRLDDVELGQPDDEFTTIIDVRAFVERRRAAIALHASQRSPYDAMPPMLADAFWHADRLVRLQPPWTDGPVETDLHVPDRRDDRGRNG